MNRLLESIAMTPDRSVVWQQISTEQGSLYLPGQNYRLDVKIASMLQSDEDGAIIARSTSGGTVYVPDGQEKVVVKHFNNHRANLQDNGDLSALRAHVMLETGLDRIDQKDELWRIEGASVLGALVLNSEYSERTGKTAKWIIQKVNAAGRTSDYMPAADIVLECDENGKHHRKVNFDVVHPAPLTPALPAPRERIALYDKAMAMTTHNPDKPSPHTVVYDDHDSNFIIAQLPGKTFLGRQRQGVGVKIDIYPKEGFDF